MSEELKPRIIIPIEFENPENPVDGDEIILKIDGKPVKCVFRDLSRVNFDPHTNHEVKTIMKIQPSMITIAEGGEEVTTTQDGISTSRIAEKGQVIVKNITADGTTEEPYIFGNKKDDVETQAKKFFSTYGAVNDEQAEQLRQKYPQFSAESRFFQKTAPILGIKVNEPTAIKPSWGGDFMGTPAGGYITQGEYTISAQSMADYYRVVEDKPVDQA